MGGGYFILGCGCGNKDWYHLIVFLFFLFLLFVLSHFQSFYLGGWNMMAVCLFLRFFFIFCLWFSVGVNSVEKLCLLCKTISKVSYLIIIPWISLEKGVFWFQSLFSVYYSYISRLLGRVYHFSLLIYYPCWFTLKIKNIITENFSNPKDNHSQVLKWKNGTSYFEISGKCMEQ